MILQLLDVPEQCRPRGQVPGYLSRSPNAHMRAVGRISTLRTVTEGTIATKGVQVGKLFDNLGLVLIIGLAVAILIAIFPNSGYSPNPTRDLVNGVLQWLHVFFGITWIGLLYYFNFVQIPTMPKVPAELKPAVSKYIAPAALFWFRWAALATVVLGLLVAEMSMGGYVQRALTLTEGYRTIGIGMWLGIVMAANVWFI